MTNLNITFIPEKEKISKQASEFYGLFFIEPKKNQHIQKDTSQLNISIVIDISSSMNEPVKRINLMADYFNPQQPILGNPKYNWPSIQGNTFQQPDMVRNFITEDNKQLTPKMKTKLAQSIDSAKIALEQMKNGDIFSLVIFNDHVIPVIPSVVLNEKNRLQILSTLNNLKADGCTNLHGGWLEGANQVAQKLSSSSLNRVLILTDGQANRGIVNVDNICSDVVKIFNNNISTSTFGIGESFNEDLLEKMAESGNGNFYFIDNDGKLEQLFKDEFQGIHNLVGINAQLELILNDNVTIIDQCNDFIKKNNNDKCNYIIPNLVHDKPLEILFKFKANPKSGIKQMDIGQWVLTYQNSDGKTITVSEKIVLPLAKNKELDSLISHSQINIVKALLEISRNKKNVAQYLDKGEYDNAKNLLGTMSAYASTFNDKRMLAETVSLSATINNMDSTNQQELRKSMVYQSYNTRNSKN